jgi:hypothetical protein
MRDHLIRVAFRLLRVPCGDHGGGDDYVGKGRWCLKPFGHRESHAYDNTRQPLWQVRRRFQGYDETTRNESEGERQ